MAGQSTGTPRYHVPDQSPLAISLATVLALIIIGLGSGLNSMTFGKDGEGSLSWYIFALGFGGFLLTVGIWFATTIRENRAGMNSPLVKRSYVLGMQWFIFSEVMFFAGFFGTLFYVRHFAVPWLAGEGAKGPTGQLLWHGFQYHWPLDVTPQQAVGGAAAQYPANSGTFIGPHETAAWPGFSGLLHWIPFWNTVCLVSSSVTVHFAHTALKDNRRRAFNLWLAVTLLLGFTFVGLQAAEYHEAYTQLGLTLASGIYGSTFFILTGFHGFHVCLGAIMLTVQWLRATAFKHFTPEDQFGFEASSWYWHFVDVVWIGLVLFVYVL